jgi:hypothetical protein
MEKQYINLNDVTNFKTLWHAAWLASDNKTTEVVLVVDRQKTMTDNPVVLKAQFVILSEGILNSSTDEAKKRREIDYSEYDIKDCYHLASELTKLTGYKISIKLTS